MWQKRKCTVQNCYLTIAHGTVSTHIALGKSSSKRFFLLLVSVIKCKCILDMCSVRQCRLYCHSKTWYNISKALFGFLVYQMKITDFLRNVCKVYADQLGIFCCQKHAYDIKQCTLKWHFTPSIVVL